MGNHGGRFALFWFQLPLVHVQAAEDCKLQHVTAKSGRLDGKTFDKRFWQKKPVVFRNLTAGWLASSAWADRESFLERHGDLTIGLREQVVLGSFDQSRRDVTVREYLTEDTHRHLIQFSFGDLGLYRALRPDYSPLPEALRRTSYTPAFSLGRNGTGSGGHRHEENWLAQLAGRKAWLLAPPPGAGGADEAPLSEALPPCEHWDSARRRFWPRGAVSCVVGPGEVIYVPNGWYHATCNLDDFTVGVGGRGSSRDWPEHMYHIQAGDLGALRDAAAAGADVGRGVPVTTSAGERQVHLPLHWAVESGSLDMVKFLLEARADPEERPADGTPLVSVAAGKHKVHILEHLLESGLARVTDEGDGWQPLHSAISKDSIEAVRFLLSFRADVNALASQTHQLSPLHLASASNSAEAIRLLLKHRADPTARDSSGKLPIFWAAAHNGVAALKRLKAHGARLDTPDPQGGGTILHVAAGMGHTDVLRFLLKGSQIPVDAPDRARNRAVHEAAEAGHVEAVRLLVRGRASTDLGGRTGESPAEIALRTGNAALAEELRQLRPPQGGGAGQRPGRQRKKRAREPSGDL